MTPEQMSNEELADYLEHNLQCFYKPFPDAEYYEAARRLRNSIPKPVVEVQVIMGHPRVLVNGVVVEVFHEDYGGDCSYESALALNMEQANGYVEMLTLAITQGGSDE